MFYPVIYFKSWAMR